MIAALTIAAAAAAGVCPALDAVAGKPTDAAPVLMACIARSAPGGTIALKPGRYAIRSPLTIDKPVTLISRGLAAAAPACRSAGDARCAVLAIGRMSLALPHITIPIEVRAPNVTISHLAILGWTPDPAYGAKVCGDNRTRPLGGAMRASAAGFTLNRSLIRGAGCYTALEVTTAADRPTLTGNIIGPNGDHNPGGSFSDGMTVHDTSHATITGNSFIDNTDVQLILGGCRQCRVTGNRFRHGGSFKGASFAELMIHAWPTTSGRYDGTVVSGNDVDCGPARRCGYGIMIGASPWYKAPTSGGEVSGNRVANARLGINVDGLTGPMTIRDNRIVTSGGTYDSACGRKAWPALNIAPSSRAFARGISGGGIETSGCLLNSTPD
ncbi:right-handed parallel beta-helix repeat-containing protein [Sphingomonas profundi]|uniref:right-handed parallel beta-helix repeat-containing protein n=1 Tax=Alterirhizorhabdus profundi TaxID=2681549 RepID=UPI0018D01AB5|nr:right-handed parallel beta-helix repeat-containing protein [Sphingomonas profundi]